MLKIEIKGIGEVQKNLRAIAARFPKEARGALTREAEFIMTESKEWFVPVKDGHLRASGHVVIHPEPAIKVTLGFGGPAGIGKNTKDVGYAIVQHERTDFSHKIGEAKYLERPVMAALPNLAKRIATALSIKGKW